MKVIQLHPRPRRRRPSSELASTALYDGRTYLGSINEKLNGQWEAGKANGESLGLFTSASAAANALIAASRGA